MQPQERQLTGTRHWPTPANLNAISFVALLAGAVALGSGAIRVASAFHDTLDVTLQTAKTVTTPIVGSVPAGPFVLEERFPTAAISATGISNDARILVAAAAIVGTLCAVVVALTIAYLCQCIRRGSPFVRSLTTALFAASPTLMIGGVIGQGLTAVGASVTATQLNSARGNHDFVAGGPIDLTPIVAGVVLGVIAAAFRMGERMQHDTEGLV